MKRLHTWVDLVGSTSVILLGGTLLAVACGNEDEKGAPSGANAGAATAGESSTRAGGGSVMSQGGEQSQLGGAGGQSSEPETTSGAGAGGAPSEGGDCYVSLAMNTSNAVDGDKPLTERCEALTFDGQMNFEIYAGEGLDQRNLNIDFFESPVMGASIDLSKPSDFAAGKGGAASYVDPSGVWNADKGSVTIVKVEGDLFTVKLSDVHFVVLDGGPVAPTNSGEFVASGTITATSMPGQ
jgi:hypothetical protein